MKHFLEVFCIALAMLFFSFGEIPMGIFATTFSVLAFLWPNKTSKSPEQIYTESNGEKNSNIFVEYMFESEPNDKFTVNLHSYDSSPDTVIQVLAEYIKEHTGVAVSPNRLKVLSIKTI